MAIITQPKPKRRVSAVRYYIHQYGGFWRMSPSALREFLYHGSHGGGWNLDNYGKALNRTPPGVRHIKYNRDESAFEAVGFGVVLLSPLDWGNAEFAEAYERFFDVAPDAPITKTALAVLEKIANAKGGVVQISFEKEKPPCRTKKAVDALLQAGYLNRGESWTEWSDQRLKGVVLVSTAMYQITPAGRLYAARQDRLNAAL